jgi:hypothetical protein
MVRLKMPCCVAFCEEASLPSGVVGPRDLNPLIRADSDLREAVILRVGYEGTGIFVVGSGEEVVGTGEVIVRAVGEFAQVLQAAPRQRTLKCSPAR